MIQKLLIVVCMVALVSVSARSQGLQVRGNARQPVQQFPDAARLLGEKIPIVVENNRLDLALPDRDMSFSVCREIAGGRGGGSSSSNNMWSCNSSSGTVRAEMGNSFEPGTFLAADRPPGKSVLLYGLESPFQRTTIRQSPEELLAFHLDTANSRVFWMKASGSQVVLVNIDGPAAESWKAETWEQLNSSHDLLALCADLRNLGISLPKTAPFERVASLIRELVVFPDSAWQEFMKEFEGLNSAKFDERDAASARLAKETDSWKAAIAWGLLAPATPPEVKSRLRAAIAANPELAANHLIHTLTSAKLHQSPIALIRVIESGLGSSLDNGPVFAQLRNVTGQQIDDDLRAWKDWHAQSNSKRPDAEAGNDRQKTAVPLSDDDVEERPNGKTGFDSAKVGLSRLLGVTLNDQGRWILDRESWRVQFGGRDSSELIADLKTQFKDSGLPESWLNIGKGFDPDLLGYPQILFEKYTDSLVQVFATPQERQMAQMRLQNQVMRSFAQVNQKTLNRQYDASGVRAVLTMHPEQMANRENVAEEFFDLEVAESGESGRLIHFREEQDGSLKLFCMGPGQKTILSLGQNPDGDCWIHRIESGKVTTLQADNALTLLSENRDWFDREVKPLFADLGIGLGVAAGGPLSITDQRPIE